MCPPDPGGVVGLGFVNNLSTIFPELLESAAIIISSSRIMYKKAMALLYRSIRDRQLFKVNNPLCGQSRFENYGVP